MVRGVVERRRRWLRRDMRHKRHMEGLIGPGGRRRAIVGGAIGDNFGGVWWGMGFLAVVQ